MNGKKIGKKKKSFKSTSVILHVRKMGIIDHHWWDPWRHRKEVLLLDNFFY